MRSAARLGSGPVGTGEIVTTPPARTGDCRCVPQLSPSSINRNLSSVPRTRSLNESNSCWGFLNQAAKHVDQEILGRMGRGLFRFRAGATERGN